MITNNMDIGSLIERELGSTHIMWDAESRSQYGRDASGRGTFLPEVVVMAHSLEEVKIVLRLSDEYGFPVTPRGAGTGLSGGALPVCGGVVLSTEPMARIKEIDSESLIAIVEPGVVTGELQKQVEELGLFYPPDPASLVTCTIGGNVAHNAGGPRAFKYGVTRDYVLGLEAVLPTGTSFRCGRRTAKGVTGYDLTATLVGSEGTLAITTEVILKLIPSPRAYAVLLAKFKDVFAAARAVTEVVRGGHRPRALELVDRPALTELTRQGKYHFAPEVGAILICELDGNDESSFQTTLSACEELFERSDAIEIQRATNAEDRDQLWAARRAVYPTLLEAYPGMLTEDLCVPRARIPDLLKRADELSAALHIPTANVGHAGDGNVHIGLLRSTHGDPREDELKRVNTMTAELARACLDLGGTLTGEHGIGYAKRDYLSWELKSPTLEIHKRLKQLFDPKGRLNPKKIFSD